MIKKQSQILTIIKKSKILRTLNILMFLLLFLSIVLFISNKDISKKIKLNKKTMDENTIQLQTLKNIADSSLGYDTPDEELLNNKNFAAFEDVIPFISYLEELLQPIDEEVSVLVKAKEDQIIFDRYADYTVNIQLHNKLEQFYEAIKKLNNSHFILNITNININYKPSFSDDSNVLSEITLKIRLFLK